jgi:hypothetical protein
VPKTSCEVSCYVLARVFHNFGVSLLLGLCVELRIKVSKEI